MREVVAGNGKCPACGRADVKLYRIRTEQGQEYYQCEICGTRSGQPDPDVPEGTERLARAIEELAREIRVTRGLLLDQAIIDAAEQEAPDGTG